MQSDVKSGPALNTLLTIGEELGYLTPEQLSSVDELQRVPQVVAVAGGVSKAISLLGAVRTRIPKVLITDQLTAESLAALADRD